MPFRILQYICRIMNYHLHHLKKECLPIVYPIVFYHGEVEYSYSTDLYDLFEDTDLAKEIFLQPFKLVDVGKISDKEIKQQQWSGVMEFIFKHIFARDFLSYLLEIMPHLHKMTNDDGSELVETVLNYSLNKAQHLDKFDFFQTIKSQSWIDGEKIMTIAEILKKEGRQEGRQKGRQEAVIDVAKKLLKEGTDPMFVTRVTGLSITQVRKLAATQPVK